MGKDSYSPKQIAKMKVRLLPAEGTFERSNLSGYKEKHLDELPGDERWDLRAYEIEGGQIGSQVYGRGNASTAQVRALLQTKYASGKVKPQDHAVYLRTPIKKNAPIKIRPARDFSHLDALVRGEVETD